MPWYLWINWTSFFLLGFDIACLPGPSKKTFWAVRCSSSVSTHSYHCSRQWKYTRSQLSHLCGTDCVITAKWHLGNMGSLEGMDHRACPYMGNIHESRASWFLTYRNKNIRMQLLECYCKINRLLHTWNHGFLCNIKLHCSMCRN